METEWTGRERKDQDRVQEIENKRGIKLFKTLLPMSTSSRIVLNTIFPKYFVCCQVLRLQAWKKSI